ncbi:MAG: NO-inducible flavohemoprotein [Oleispira antarctica]|uniref:Flavohemoprotein n=1 Tax=Oleispira antarctica RB-8 TaxID=698738 RepID=R4YTV2_OLEAN|nr:NO-inducible flavohemoprotein [Oleispira antarctica]MBQ0791568.1 NO-inducible flavohemoprotein [Oleispira antarctica]CCK77328.1 Flavohemoprotein [Oleispira antarctica RB-8]|tara:strand:+ start:4750 stop:5970 length:1221 start_codon:yes stop_codon:yes gene_type:complete
MLSNEHIQLVKSTVPLLEASGSAITDYFYNRLFTHNPEAQNIFNMSNQASGKQSFALFSAIAAYAKNLDNVEQLLSMVERIAQKHTSLNIQPEHYDLVGHHLIETLRELVPEQFTADVEEAWTVAYQALAAIFIAREGELYKQREVLKGGWKGGRQFKLVEKRIESELVKSLVFEPVDGGPVIDYQAGQYIGIEVQPKQSEFKEIRQYSLSDKANGESYRISVKREIVGKPGIVSNYLHDGLRLADEVTLYAPAGDFFLNKTAAPVVLISAGVGLTPMQSMLETLLAEQGSKEEGSLQKSAPQKIHFLHACENSAQHSFKKRLTSLVQKNKVKALTWYKSETLEQADIHHGFMDLVSVEEQLPLALGDFYLCGPVAFMQFAKQQLVTLGVNDDRIHYEVFGPHESF